MIDSLVVFFFKSIGECISFYLYIVNIEVKWVVCGWNMYFLSVLEIFFYVIMFI